MNRTVAAFILGGLVLAWTGALAQQQAAPKGVPEKVMKTLTKKFSGAEITKWTQEREQGKILYDIEFTKGGQKFEADIVEDGTLDSWERAVTAAELPATVRNAAEKLYPGSTIKQTMEKLLVKKGKDVPEGYEITLTTRDKKSVEVTVAPNGTVLEAPGANKK